MTACVKQSSKAKGGALSGKVLRAALAAVLAIGLMPALAFADDGVSTLATVTPADAFKGGEVTAAVDNDENAVDLGSSIEWTVDGEAHYVIPTEVTPEESAAVDVTDEATYAINYYQKDAAGDTDLVVEGETVKVKGIAGSDIKDAGTYYAVVFPKTGTTYDGGYLAIEFSIVSKSLKGAYAYEVQKDASDLTDTTFTYDGGAIVVGDAEGDVAFALNGEKLVKGEDYSATILAYNAGTTAQVTPQYAGDYVLVLTGETGSEYDGSEAQVPLKISPLDLSSANIVANTLVENGSVQAPSVKSINGSDALATALAGQLKLTFSSASNGDSLLKNTGTYTYSVAVNDADKTQPWIGSITGTGSVSFDVVESDQVFFAYNGAAWQTEVDVDHSDATKPDFDLSKIAVYKGTAINADNKLESSQYTVTVTDKDGNAATAADVTTPGTWIVTVTVNAAAADYEIGGSAQATVTVIDGTLNAAEDIYVKYDGSVAGNTVSVMYDGTNALDKIEIVAKTDDGEKTLVAGSDYKVKITNSKGEEVAEAINVDEYELTISSGNYVINPSEVVTLNVTKLTPKATRVAGLQTVAGETGLPYTGSAIEVAFEYTLDDFSDTAKFPNGIEDEGITWVTIPAEAYEATITFGGKKVDEVVKSGEYTVSLAANTDEANAVIANNYAVAGGSIYGGDMSALGTFEVIDPYIFADVSVADWYAEVVYQASFNKYMNGYYGTQLFGPNDNITRADVVCVLFNMAGNNIDDMDEGAVSELKGYATGFSDVDANMYYAAAIGWAAKTGVVNGYDDNTFAPSKQISREEFAAMLANYAKAKGDDMTVDADAVLAEFADGSDVSEWAQNVVAWCADNGIMGNGGSLSPLDAISRAEVAAMAINYQPKALIPIAV